MEKYKNNVQDQFGNAITGVTVTIRTNPGGVLATIYSDNGVTPKSNPFTNDADGEFFFYAANGRYDIELTGPIVETVTDWLLQDIPSSLSGNVRVLTDTDAPGGPTGDVGTGVIEYYDSDESDLLARIGYYGSTNGNFRLRNEVHAGHMELTGQDTGGVERFLLVGDPDTSVDIYYPGAGAQIIRASSQAAGLNIHSDGNADNENRLLRLTHQDGTLRGIYGHQSGTSILTVQNDINGGGINVNLRDGGGTIRNVIVAQASGPLDLYYSATDDKRLSMEAGGVVRLYGDGNTDAEIRSINFTYQTTDTNRARVGHIFASDIFAMQNQVHGGNIGLYAEDAGGGSANVLVGDPDGSTNIYAAGENRLAVTGNGIVSVYGSDNTDAGNRVVDFRYANGTLRGEVGHGVGSSTMVLNNQIHGGDVSLVGENTSGVTRTGVQFDPDGAVTLYYGGSSNVASLRTQQNQVADQSSGAEVLDGNNVWQDVGFNVLGQQLGNANYTIDRSECGYDLYKNAGAAVTYTIPAAASVNQTDIPPGAVFEITNEDTENLTINGTQAGITLRWLPSGGTGNRTLAQWGNARLKKRSDSLWFITGVGLT